MTQGLRWYLTSTALFLIPGGIQIVLFPYLVAVHLHESPTRVGLAQMSAQLPMLLFLLWGGVVGDRVDQRRLLIGLQLGMMLPPLTIAYLTHLDAITYSVLIGWALIGGTFGAFAQPARDALLNRIAGDEIQRVVILSIGVQYGVQIVGFAVGSLASVTGVITVLCVQSSVLLLSSFATYRIPLDSAPARPQRKAALHEIAEGLRIAWHSSAIRPAIIQAFSVGIFFAGTYVVILPLMVRDIYQGGSPGIAAAFAANMLGTCTTVFVLMKRGGVEWPGRALLIGSLFSLSILSILTWDLPMWLFYGVVYCWGLCGGIGMTMSRAIVQEAAPANARARLLSVYSLGFMGGMPIGSALLGWSVDHLGAHQAVWVPVIGMLGVTLSLFAFTDLRTVRRHQPTA